MTLRRARPYWSGKKGGGQFPTSGLLAYYKLEETSGTTMIDSFGSFDGTIENEITINQTGKIDKCYRSELNGFVILPNEIFTGVSSASFNMWVKLDMDTPSSTGKSGFARLNNSDFITTYPWTDGIIYMGILTPVRKTIGAGIVADKTQWHMVTVTANSDTDDWKFYQNGTLVTTDTIGGPIVFDGILTLARSSNNVILNGFFDEVSIHNRALSPEEITNIYNSGNGMTL